MILKFLIKEDNVTQTLYLLSHKYPRSYIEYLRKLILFMVYGHLNIGIS